MTIEIEAVTVDAEHPAALARFWCDLLGYEVVYSDTDDTGAAEVEIAPADGREGWRILFVEVHDERKVKNRLHFDLRPADRDAEVARAESLGAKRIDIGQGEQTWVVMADPEGNEFCILRARTPDD